MRVTILHWAVILTKAHRAAASMMAKGSIVTWVAPLRCFLFLLPSYIHVYANMMQYCDILTRGKYCGLSTEVFIIFTTQQYSFLCDYGAIVSYIDKKEYCNRNTPKPQYPPLLTSGG